MHDELRVWKRELLQPLEALLPGGLLPGGGGIVRMVNKFGAERAIMPLLEGTRFSADKAHAAGLVEELADSPEDMIAKAKAWVKSLRSTITTVYGTCWSGPEGVE